MTPSQARTYLEHAPKDVKVVDGLKGFWLKDGYYICSTCAARIMARGCGGFVGAEPVWNDEDKPFGVCVGCETKKPDPLLEESRPFASDINAVLKSMDSVLKCLL
jgi:hypothetical protein